MDTPIGALFARRARREPDTRLVVDSAGGEAITAADLDAAATCLAGRLTEMGVRRDDLVTVALPTSVRFVVAVVAVWKAGAVPLPVPPDLADDERAHLDALARPAAVIGVCMARTSTPCVPSEEIPVTGDGRSPDAAPDRAASSWKATTSSGSTGPRKIVRSTTPAWFDPDRAVAPFLPPRSTQLVTADLWHSAAFTYAFRGLMTDHRLVLAPRVPVVELPETIRREGVTWTVTAPSLIRRLVRLPASLRGEVPALAGLVHLGAPCPDADKRALIDWLGPDRVLEVYASSESLGVTMISGRDWLDRPGSVGRGIGGTEVAIRDERGRDLGVGEVGTVWMRRDGPARYAYVGAPSSRTSDGWDTAGDLGRLDADGFLYLLGRAGDRLDCAGMVVDPARVEAELLTHPAVDECLVHGDPEATTISAIIAVAGHDDPTVLPFARSVLRRHCEPGRITLRHNPIRDTAGKARRPTSS
ncbi:AMP-binding protein [Williamsia sp. SKLECPSW1]